MTIEKTERSRWRAKPKAVVLEPGYVQTIRDGFGSVDVLKVNSPDSLTITRSFDPFHHFPGPPLEEKDINKEKLSEVRPFPMDVIDSIIGRRVAFTWRASDKPNTETSR